MNPFVILIVLISSGVSIVFIVEALGYPPSARDMPIIYASTVLLLCSGVVAEQWKLAKINGGKPKHNLRNWFTDHNKLRAFAIILIAGIYIIAIQKLGYIFPTVAFFVLAATINRTVSLRATVVGTVVVIALIGFVFIEFLRLPLDLFPDF